MPKNKVQPEFAHLSVRAWKDNRFRPEGPAVRPAQGNVLRKGTPAIFVVRSAQRAKNSPRREENSWPVGPEKNRRFPIPQGVTLGWANGWAFGPNNCPYVQYSNGGVAHFPEKNLDFLGGRRKMP